MAEDVSQSAHPNAAAFVAGAGTALVAALVLAVIDGLAAGATTLPTVIGLWALPGFGFALYAGAIAAGFRATFGARAFGTLAADRERDASWTAFVLAGIVAAIALAIFGSLAAKMIVAKAHRPEAGAKVLGSIVVIGAIAMALLILPLQRVLRIALVKLPRFGPVPHAALALVIAAVVILAYARKRLYGAGFDNAALPMAALAQLVLLPVLALGLGAIFYGPLRRVRTALPPIARAALVVVALLFALVHGARTMRPGHAPSEAVARGVTEHGLASATFVSLGRSMIDGDGDGVSGFFRGPDCDDRDATVNPNAKEIAHNGKDDNCQGGDRTTAEPVVDAAPPPTAATDAGVAPPPAGPKPNVVIIMVDTLRVDRLGASGYQRDGKSLTPRLDGFLAQSVWFKRAYANANNTPRSMPSFMASRYPSLVAVDKMHSKYPRVDDANELLFEQLQAGGLRTIGETSHFYFRDERNFTQGFDAFNNDGALDIGPSNKDVASPRIVPRVLAQLAERGKDQAPFAMFVHLFEPHSSFVEHDGFPPVTASGTKAHAQRYDYEIAFVDGYIGQILDGIDAAGLTEETIVVLMSDHGEAFGEHNFAGQSMFHGTNLYDEQLRVPFAFRVPGAAPRQVDTVVQLLDLAPTVAELAGVAAAKSWLGRSLAPAIRGEALAPKPIFAELLAYPGWEHDLKMVVSGDGAWKLINVISQRRFELYDLAGDPGEKQDRFRDASAAAARATMEQLLLDWVEVTLAQ